MPRKIKEKFNDGSEVIRLVTDDDIDKRTYGCENIPGLVDIKNKKEITSEYSEEDLSLSELDEYMSKFL